MGTITSREACVDHVIGSAYQVVRYVAANMQSIIDVSGAMPQLELWMPSIASVLAAVPTISNVNTNLPVIANVNSNLTTLSNINANMAALLNINSNMAALLAIPGVIQAQDFKNSVAVATTANIALTGLQTIDGYSVPVGARVLVKNQTTPAENGIYVAATGAWARSSDGAAGMLSTGCQVSVDRGTVGAGKQFRLATLGTITVGTTAQSWVEMSSASNVLGQEDDGTPLTVLAPHELQFDNQHFSLTAVAQGVAIALSTEILDAIAAGGGGGGSGETNTASNLGTGAGLYAAKVGADLRFKSLVAGSNVTFDVTPDSITVNATGGGSGGIAVSAVDSLGSSDTITDVQTLAFDPDEFFYDGDALGLGIHLAPGALGAIGGVGGATGTGASGHQLFKDKVGTELVFKTLIAGDNVTIEPDVSNNSLTISATSGGGGGGLTALGKDAEDNYVEQPDVVWMYFDINHFSTTPYTNEVGNGITMGLHPDFLKTIPKDPSPVWQNPTTRRIVAGGPALVGLAPATMSPAITANATWILPFLHTKNWADIKSIAMQFGGTIPAGSVQLSIQEFPGNPIVDTELVQPLIWQETFTYSELASGAAVNLPTRFGPYSGIYLMYIRFLIAAPNMTVKQITSLSAAGNTLIDPLAELMSYTGIAQGSCALTRTYSTFPGTNDPTPIHPFNDGVAVGTTTAPAITLIVETETSS